MPQRFRLPAWAWIVGAGLLAAVVLLGYRALQIERQLKTLRNELVGEPVHALAGAAELEQMRAIEPKSLACCDDQTAAEGDAADVVVVEGQ